MKKNPKKDKKKIFCKGVICKLSKRRNKCQYCGVYVCVNCSYPFGKKYYCIDCGLIVEATKGFKVISDLIG